jgi:hypothetical protein
MMVVRTKLISNKKSHLCIGDQIYRNGEGAKDNC